MASKRKVNLNDYEMTTTLGTGKYSKQIGSKGQFGVFGSTLAGFLDQLESPSGNVIETLSDCGY